ncbi:hypothetical protein P4C99_09010 [Pontiellaceae bacterium B1224]|nr:hypothetical protein [Pontiellaceae bacterium B1224]
MKRIIGMALGIGLACSAQADIAEGQIIGIDFGGIAPAGVSTFNQFSVGGDASTAGLVAGATNTLTSVADISGSTVSGVQFSLINNSGQIAWDFVNGSAGYGLMTDASVYGDALISNNASGRNLPAGAHFVLRFTGLDDSLTYELDGGFEFNNQNFNATWEADGQSFTTDINNGAGWGTLTGLSTDGSGNLDIMVTRSNHIAVGGLTLEAIPEPATQGLVATFGGAVLFIRRRFMI